MSRVSDTEGQWSQDCRNLANDDQMETDLCKSLFPNKQCEVSNDIWSINKLSNIFRSLFFSSR